MVNHTKHVCLVSFSIFCFIVSTFCCVDDVFADVYSVSLSASDNIVIDLSPSHNAQVSKDNVIVNSTCPLGYTLTMSGPVDSNLYKDGDFTKSSIKASVGTISDPKPILGEMDDGAGGVISFLNTWGYSLGEGVTTNSDFVGLSNTTSVLANKTSASMKDGDIYSIYFGVSIEDYKEPGLYEFSDNNAITYSLTADVNCSNFSIIYDGNDDDGEVDMNVSHVGVLENDEIILYAPNYKRGGYGFVGWSTIKLDPDSNSFREDLDNAVAEGKVYGPNETILVDAAFLRQSENIEGSNVITLYAVWVGVQKDSNGSELAFQSSNVFTTTLPDGKNLYGEPNGYVTALRDERDNQVYAIAKLDDSRYWMIENLRLESQGTTGDINKSLSQGYGTSSAYGNFIGLANSESADFIDSTTANSLYSTNENTAVKIGTSDSPGLRFPRYNNLNTVNAVSHMDGADTNVYSYGNYYSWHAGIASTTFYKTLNQSISDTSICPKNWFLPRGGERSNEANNDFWYLIVTKLNKGVKPTNYDSSDKPSYVDNDNTEGTDISKLFRAFPYDFIFSGRFNGDSATGSRGSSGNYWSSTVKGSKSANYLYFTSSRVDPGTNSVNPARGNSIRCVSQSSDVYTVSFNANGGTGNMATQDIYTDVPTALNSNSFTAPKNESFYRWNTKADGTGTSYTDGQTVTNLAATGSTIVLYAQWKDICPANKICYNDNGVNSSYTMEQQSIGSTDTSAVLWASNFRRDGYGFAGWNTKSDGTGISYGPNQTITFSAGQYSGAENGLKLYAIWVESAGNLQNWAGCSSLAKGKVTALTDTRDNNVYAVAKLTDGKCWMIENMRLNTAGSLNKTTSQGWGGVFSGLANPESANFSEVTTANSRYSTSNIGTNDYPAYRMPRYNNSNQSNSTVIDLGDKTYGYGNYYTWSAAVANTSVYTTANTSLSTSICPAGWRLPKGGFKNNEANNEVWKLFVTGLNSGTKPANYSSTTMPFYTGTSEVSNLYRVLRTYPNNFVLSGVYRGSAIDGAGYEGLYWTSTVVGPSSLGNVVYAFYMRVSENEITPGTRGNKKFLGFPIRCIIGT